MDKKLFVNNATGNKRDFQIKLKYESIVEPQNKLKTERHQGHI